MDEAELLDQIAEAPDEPGPYLIYADLLQQRGDPRGDLIVVQHALEAAPDDVALRRREEQLIRAHRDAWFDVGAHAATLEVQWRRGFVHAARITASGDRSTLLALLALPHAPSTLAELRLDRDLARELRTIITALARRWPRSLRRLHVADSIEQQGAAPYSLAPLAEVVGRLETLVVGGSHVELGSDPHYAETLRRFEARTDVSIIEQLGGIARWPALEHLAVRADGASLVPHLTRERFPRLRSLSLPGTRNTARLCADLATLEIAAALAHLDVSGGDLGSAADVERLPPQLALDVRRNLLSSEAAAALAARDPGSDTAARHAVYPQRDPTQTEGELDDAMLEAIEALHGATPAEAPVHYRRLIELAELRGDDWLVDGYRGRFAKRLPVAEALAELRATASSQARRLTHVDELAIGEVLHELGDPNAEPWLLRATTRALLSRDPAREGQAMHALGVVERTRSDLTAAEASLRRALELARMASDSSTTARVLSSLAGIARDRGELGEAMQLLGSAIDARDDMPLETARDRHELASLLLDEGRLDAAWEVAIEAHGTFGYHEDHAGLARADGLIGEIARMFGNDFVAARSWLDDSLARSRRLHSAEGERSALLSLARVANDLGDHHGALALAKQALATTAPAQTGIEQLTLADVALGDRRYYEARLCCERARAALRIGHWRARARLRKGIAAQLERADAEAQSCYEDAIRDAGDHAETVAWIELWFATLLARTYRARDAAEMLRRATERFPTMTHRTRDAIMMARALLANLGAHGGVSAGVPGYVMALALMDKVQGKRTPLPAVTNHETRLLARVDDPWPST